jgi:hypothetical protein
VIFYAAAARLGFRVQRLRKLRSRLLARKGISLSSPSLDLTFISAAMRPIDSGAGLAELLSTDRFGGVAQRNHE